ncbi:MAG TPA: alpha/beta hydrolase [Acidimicrobiales bacterium]|nr:alpha/beta hydrolase [Acidimicrobiales bacterium]
MGETVQVHSADGAHIGFERIGSGPPLLLVHGGTADRSRWKPVVPALSARFTLLIPDRRGRGLSKEEPEAYAIEREAEDLLAIVESVPGGGTVRVFAHSFGALVAMEAAMRTKAIGAMVLYEPPFPVPGGDVIDRPMMARFEELLAVDDREGALEHFFTNVLELPPAVVEGMKGTPIWSARLAAVHTIVREGRAVQSWRLDPERLASIQGPVRLLLGTETTPALDAASRALARAMPAWELVAIEGQGHLAIDAATDVVTELVLGHLY